MGIPVTGNGTAVTGLGGPSGYGETLVTRSDDDSLRLDLGAVFDAGFRIGGATVPATSVWLNTNGSLSFGGPVAGVPGTLAGAGHPVIAPFLADIDTRLDGEGAESGPIWLDVDPVTDVVTVTWADVGFYRRDATLTNLFQVQLYDRGGGAFDIVFRYSRIDWTSGLLEGGYGGTGGTAALAGYLLDTARPPVLLPASGIEAGLLGLETATGNTGQPGLWVFSIGQAPPGVITGGIGADLLAGTAGNDTVEGMSGNDTLLGSAGADRLNGGPGNDLADYNAAPAGVVVDMAAPSSNTGWAAGDTFDFVEDLRGTTLRDDLRGDDLGNLINGHAGHDTVSGRGGADTLLGSLGNDTLFGGAGNDVLNGGAGNDDLRGEDGDDRLVGEAGADTMAGGEGNNILVGGDGDDVIEEASGNSSLYGGAGNDMLTGADGNDWSYGASGNDTLNAGPGNDRLAGDAGTDLLTGGSGIDWFIFRPDGDRDRVTDFRIGQDRLLLEATLWPGDLTPAQIVASYARVIDGFVVFSFPAGTDVLLDGVTGLHGLSAAIILI